MGIYISPLSIKVESLYAKKPPNQTTRGGFLVVFLLCLRYNMSMNIIVTVLVPVLVALIGASASIAGSFMAMKKGQLEREVKDAQREQRQTDRLERLDEKIERLEKKVDEHNGYAEKFAENSKSMAVIATKIEHLEKKMA